MSRFRLGICQSGKECRVECHLARKENVRKPGCGNPRLGVCMCVCVCLLSVIVLPVGVIGSRI